MNLVITITAAILSAILTGWIRQYALQHRILDVPNERSSHTTPTPRSGGLGFVISYFIGLAFIAVGGVLAPRLLAALVIGGAIIASVGYLDDVWNLSFGVRLAAHLAASTWGLFCLRGMPSLDVGFAAWHWGWLGHIVGVIGLVWLINLYNFMDGIDGLAASEAVFVSLFAGLLLMSKGHSGLMWSSLLLASACLGFLVWNWPPAKIFMGDVGSGFLGYVLGILALASADADSHLPLIWLILLGVFVTDATVTLFMRVGQHKPFLQAHRSHAYQHAAARFGSHRKVMLTIQALNVVWLGGCALLGWHHPSLSGGVWLVSLLPLVGLALYFRAGHDAGQYRDRQQNSMQK